MAFKKTGLTQTIGVVDKDQQVKSANTDVKPQQPKQPQQEQSKDQWPSKK